MHGTLAKLSEEDRLRSAIQADPVFGARLLCPHWFREEMPWFHRGIMAIILRRADFLLNFGPEDWPEGSCRWTKKKLAKIVRTFRYRENPADERSRLLPIFRIRYKEDGRTPDAIDMVIGVHVVIIIPRGFSKTTLVNFCNILKILFKWTKFTVYISEAKDHAKAQLATIQRELSSNERIIALFGRLKPERTDDETWGAEQFETVTGIKFVAKGRGAQIRGLNKFADRPDTIVLDDVEDLESCETEPQREKVLTWHVSDVTEALPRGREGYIYAIGTILHPKALLPTLAKDPDYTAVQLGALVGTGEFKDSGKKDANGDPIMEEIQEPLWDSKYGLTLEKIAAKKASFAAKGKLFNFGLEILSTVRLQDKLKFRPEYIRYRTYQPQDFIARSIHIDPAIGKGSDACYTAIAVVGIMENGHKHVCDFLAKEGMPMSDQAEEYFNMKMRWNCTHHSSESVAYQAALAQVIRSLMFAKAKTYGPKAYFEIIDTWPAGRKIERVEGILQPLMASGYLTFQQIWPELEVMFNDWPNDKLDGPDAIAGAIATIEPQFAALTYGDSDALAAPLDEDCDYEAPCAMGGGEVP